MFGRETLSILVDEQLHPFARVYLIPATYAKLTPKFFDGQHETSAYLLSVKNDFSAIVSQVFVKLWVILPKSEGGRVESRDSVQD